MSHIIGLLLLCWSWHNSFCLEAYDPPSPPPHPLPPVSSHPEKLTLQPFFASVAVPYFCLQCLPSILLYWRDLQLALLCFQGIDFHKLRLVPIISVGAVMIRLWIISLDHCFPLLHWLGAIHLPPSSGVTDAVKLPLLFTSLLSLLPPHLPRARHMSQSSFVLLCRAVFKLRCSQCQPCAFMDQPEIRKHLYLILLSARIYLYLSRKWDDKSIMLFILRKPWNAMMPCYSSFFHRATARLESLKKMLFQTLTMPPKEQSVLICLLTMS